MSARSFNLLKRMIEGEGGLVEGMNVTTCAFTLNYHLETGEEIDLVLEDEQTLVMVECKNYAPKYLYKITPQMVDDFVDKAHRLHARFADRELRVGFFSKHGLQPSLEEYLTAHNIAVL